jgi:hypothetical protein
MRSIPGSSVARLLIAAPLALSLAACLIGDAGYVEIRTVPVAATAALYLNFIKLDPLKNGSAVLRQSVGIAKLAIEGDNGRLAMLCEIEVRKDRITTVTVSVQDHPPRCQCRNAAATAGRSGVRPCVG